MEVQSIGDFLKPLIAVIGPILATQLSGLFRTSVGRRSKALAEMEFLSSFLSFDLTHRPRIIVEQAFAIHFKTRFDFDQIKAVLNLLNPYRSFMLLSNAKKFVEVTDTFEFKYKDGYSTKSQRRKKRVLFYIAYSIPAYIALAPWFYYDKVPFPSFSVYVFFGVIAELIFVVLALMQLFKSTDLDDAEEFMAEYEKTKKARSKGSIALPPASDPAPGAHNA